jgi:hypothetical protein
MVQGHLHDAVRKLLGILVGAVRGPQQLHYACKPSGGVRCRQQRRPPRVLRAAGCSDGTLVIRHQRPGGWGGCKDGVTLGRHLMEGSIMHTTHLQAAATRTTSRCTFVQSQEAGSWPAAWPKHCWVGHPETKQIFAPVANGGRASAAFSAAGTPHSASCVAMHATASGRRVPKAPPSSCCDASASVDTASSMTCATTSCDDGHGHCEEEIRIRSDYVFGQPAADVLREEAPQ